MKFFIQVIWANTQLQYKDYFFNKSIYMSLLIWPLILFINAYYSYQPFSTQILVNKVGLKSYNELYLFLFIGFVGMMFFWCLVQSAWKSAYTYRISGILELIYMSPANRFACLLGNAIASLIGSVWMLIVFAVIVITLYSNYIIINILSLLVSILVLFILAITWGVFLNSLFLVSRDGGFIYTILEAPMEIFSGVKLPFSYMPIWAKIIGYLFPLTYILTILRRSILFGDSLSDLFPNLIICSIIELILVLLSFVILYYGEKRTRITGSATLF